MRKTLFLTAALSAASLTLAAPASAEVGRFDPGLQSLAQSPAYTNVQFRHGGGGHRGGFDKPFHHGFGRGAGFGRHYGGFGRRYGGGGWHHHGGGFGVGAGIAGLAAGAIIGGALASQAAPAYADESAVAYCSRKFKSYDPSSGTYLGYDGDRHACP